MHIYIHACVGVHMHSCRRLFFICTVQSLCYMRVYHRCFLTPTCVCVGALEVGFFPTYSCLALVVGVGGYVLAGIEVGGLSHLNTHAPPHTHLHMHAHTHRHLDMENQRQYQRHKCIQKHTYKNTRHIHTHTQTYTLAYTHANTHTLTHTPVHTSTYTYTQA